MDPDLIRETGRNILPSFVVLLTSGKAGEMLAEPRAAGFFRYPDYRVAIMEVR
jgi:hypothetical protein